MGLMSQGIDWDPTNPEEWTRGRVLHWLDYHQFGRQWIEAFKRNDICHQRFLELSNYNNLKQLGLSESTSRFIRMLRSFRQVRSISSPLDNVSAADFGSVSSQPTFHKKTRSLEKYLYLKDNYRPQHRKQAGSHVLVTLDNANFSLVGISGCGTGQQVVDAIKDALALTGNQVTVHLTEYLYVPGDALSPDQVWSIVDAAAGDMVKLYLNVEVKSPSPLHEWSEHLQPNSNGHTPLSFSDEAYSDNAVGSPNGKPYPVTPAHLISNAEAKQFDYFNIKPSRLSLIAEQDERPSLPSTSIIAPSTIEDPPSTRRSPESTRSEALDSHLMRSVEPLKTHKKRYSEGRSMSIPQALTPLNESPGTFVPPEVYKQESTATLLSRTISANSTSTQTGSSGSRRGLPQLKVVLPGSAESSEPRQINFDNKRSSPYEGSSSHLVAQRIAPPPPLARQESSKYRPELSPQETDSAFPYKSNSKISRGRISMKQNASGLWDDVPEVESDTDDDNEGLWAIAPGSNEGFGLGSEHLASSTHSSQKLSERAARPSTEDVYNNLEEFFPDTDLDKPLIQIRPRAPEAAKEPGISRMKSIRVVAHEASHRMKSVRRLPSAKPILRRKSTKMWGQKVVEMREGSTITLRDKRQYVWIKGQLIGQGTFGKVYIGFNVTTGDMMAVKQFRNRSPYPRRRDERDSTTLSALYKEVENMKDLDHVNIVQYLGFEDKQDVCSLFLEYVPGGSVKSILNQYGRFSEGVIRFLTSQVLDGLSYLHSRLILHRDLKADNLLLDLDGTIKISDFGISKRSRDIYSNDAEMSMQGTIFWMAPEVVRNVVQNEKKGYSGKVDVWSLGCVILEMYAGRRPWSTEEAVGAMYKLGSSQQAPPIPEDTLRFVSSMGRDFLEKCFIIDPNERPTADLLLTHDFALSDPQFNFNDTELGRMLCEQAMVQKSQGYGP